MQSIPETRAPIAIVLVHYGQPEITQRCLASLARIETASCRIFIADHGPARLQSALDGEPPDITIIERHNDGFAAGCNAATQAAFDAGCEWVWLLNNDATLTSPILDAWIGQAQEADEDGLWGTYQLDGQRQIGADQIPCWFPDPPFTTQISRKALPQGCRQLKARETLSGASLLFSRNTWQRLGPMPEWCFLYWEDTAWCFRAHQLGIPLFLSPLHIIHPRGTATGRHSPLTAYYGVRNMLLLHAEFWPENQKARCRQAFHLIQKRIFQGRFGMIRPTLQGIRDMRRNVRGRKP